MEDRLAWRRREFMQGVDFDLMRRQREDFSVEIRKQNRLEHANKHRLLSQSQNDNSDSPGPDWLPEDLAKCVPGLLVCQTNLQRLTLLKEFLRTIEDLPLTRRILQAIRCSTCRSKERPIDELVKLGYLPGLAALAHGEDSLLASEATWIISNIAADTHENTTAVIESGAMSASLALVLSPNIDVQEHAVLTLGNIAGDCSIYRDTLLDSGIHRTFLSFLSSYTLQYHAKVMRGAAWTLCNLVRGQPRVSLSLAVEILEGIKVPFRHKDKDLRLNLMYILDSLAQGGSDVCEQIVTREFLPKVIRSVKSKRKKMAVAALRVVGFMASGTEMLTQMLLNGKILDTLLHVLPSTDSAIRTNTMWTLANIAAGSRMQLNELLNHAIIHIALRELSDPNERVRLEASYLIYNAVKIGNSEHRNRLIHLGVCSHMRGALLHTENSEYLYNVLIVMGALLEEGVSDAAEMEDGLNPQVVAFESYECIDLLHRLCSHSNIKVQKKAESLFQQYFEAPQSLEVEMHEPPSQFSFS